MKINAKNYGMVVITAVLLAAVISGCSHPQSETMGNTNGPAPAASNLTQQQQDGAKLSAQRDGEMRAAAARQQQSQHP